MKKLFFLLLIFPFFLHSEQLGIPIFKVKVDYPKKALRQGVVGKIVVQFNVNENGKASNIEIKERNCRKINTVQIFQCNLFDQSSMNGTYKLNYKYHGEYKDKLVLHNFTYVIEGDDIQFNDFNNEDARKELIAVLKDRCIEFGFSGSDNISKCIQREAQHFYEIEYLKYKQLASLSQNDQQNVPWWLQIMGAVAEGAAEGYKQSQIINQLDSRYIQRNEYRRMELLKSLNNN